MSNKFKKQYPTLCNPELGDVIYITNITDDGFIFQHDLAKVIRVTDTVCFCDFNNFGNPWVTKDGIWPVLRSEFRIYQKSDDD